MVKNINDRTTRLAYLNDKLADLQQEKLRFEELKNQQSNTLDELKTKMSKLQQIASSYGISLETHDENQKQYKILMEQNDKLMNQKRVLQAAIEAQAKRYETILSEKKKEFDEQQYTKARIVHTYNEKITILRAKGQEIQDLIEKARASGADAELQGILSKWEEANAKIFEQYPEDRPNDLAVLKQAIEEVHKPRPQATDTAAQNKAKEEARLQELKELEVQEYVKKIKLKEEDMLLAAREGVDALREKQRLQREEALERERLRQLELERMRLEEEARIQQEKDIERMNIERTVESRLGREHQKELDKKAQEKAYIEEKLKEGEAMRSQLESEKDQI